MEKRPLGKTGMNVTPLGFGAAEIGYHGIDQQTVTTLLNAALDAGLNVVDTAECYSNSEELIGNAAAHRRNEFFLFTKCGHDGKSFNLPDWDPAMLAQSIDRSLKRLKTDRVDLIQLHSCSLETLKQGDVIDVLKRARQAGKTRFIGYSGDSHAAKWAVDSGHFDTLQTSVNIADQEAVDLFLEHALEKEVGVIAKRPIANATWREKDGPSSEYHRTYWERLKKLDYDFLKRPIAESIAIALRFTLDCPAVATAIVGTTRPGRWKENAQMLGALPSQDFNAIRTRWEEIAEDDWTGQT
jgi:aryl-alcohol dehydrogenase-like predicted oxidoreductase